MSSDFQKDSLSLEETNKLRISIGLKPLTDDGPSTSSAKKNDQAPGETPPVDKDALAEDNYKRKREEDRREREEKEARERIAKIQNKRNLARKLHGPTLGEEDTADSAPSREAGKGKSTLKWLQQQRKRAKENAERIAREQEEAEALALKQLRESQDAYSERDLKGLKVAHDMDDLDMEEGEERVLTLKDSRILDDEDDELMEASLAQQEKDQLNEERKRGAKEYTGLDDEEFDDGTSAPSGRMPGQRRGILSKYDGDLDKEGFAKREDGKTGFVLGAQVESKDEIKRRKQEESARMLNRSMLDLSYTKNQEVSDYLQEGDVGFKKPKTKKKKRATKVQLDIENEDEAAGPSTFTSSVAVKKEEEEEKGEDAAMPAVAPPRDRRPGSVQIENFVDDDELAAALARSRRQKAKKVFNKMTPEEIAKNLAAQKKAEEEAKARAQAANGSLSKGQADTNGTGESNGGLTFDSTSEFVRNISLRGAASARDASEERRRRARSTIAANAEGLLEEEAVAIKDERMEAVAAPVNGRARVKIEVAEDEDAEMGEIEEEIAAQAQAPGAGANVEPTTAAEPLVSGGMAATLALLRNTGTLEPVPEEVKAREKEQKRYDRWLTQRRTDERAREEQRAASKAVGSAKDQATREYENRAREVDEALMAAERFKDYKPDVDIKYHDSHGRELGAKEAWKDLSHRFHGRDPGYRAQEKKQRRIELERQRERMAAGDTPSGMTHAFADRAEKSGQAHMVLSVGNRGNAPQDVALLGPNTQSGASAGGKGKGRNKEKDKDMEQGKGKAQLVPLLGAESSKAMVRTGSPSGMESPASAGHSNSGAQGAGGPGFAPRTMRAAFAPIRTAAATSASSSWEEAGGRGGADHQQQEQLAQQQGPSAASAGSMPLPSPLPLAATSKFRLALGKRKDAPS
ncbi:hypothetical protein K437DRAFT_254632 [Tilletiaria anomala UBC 951]|uniref:SART-1 protein n=1 Tax=Tilletiaria anomala (strain ATCC 24038 / CBS 436.72 / UBC 951) TaxID=1037660 RepID=A0A066WHS1_TILAU|nr:uncharacterized protein K437DRAFT_254632 [Tilletiaria anomala UBC 951]KDN52078.1 hypothetical protein K437DRAFT_254632 [Tilletiaria anomala UBC 951]